LQIPGKINLHFTQRRDGIRQVKKDLKFSGEKAWYRKTEKKEKSGL